MQFTEAETINHLTALSLAYADAMALQDDYGIGSWGVDQKRPFGNSGYGAMVQILEICGIDADLKDEDGDDFYSDELVEYARTLYRIKLGGFLKEAIKQYCQK